MSWLYAERLLSEVEALGVTVLADGDSLRLRPGSSIPSELVEQLRAHKAELLEVVSLRGWPQASRDAVRRFRLPEARLYPFLDKPVATPLGPGRLLQVCSEQVCVALDSDPSRAVYLLPSEVVPPGMETSPAVRDTEAN